MYLIIGVTIGVLLTVYPGAIGGFLAMHAHINLLGWLSMMIFAVAYHVLPRFSGRALYSERLSDTHVILANIGLIGLMISWPLSRYYWTPMIRLMFTGAALCYAVGAYLFVYNIMRTVLGKD
jgi:cbb3-type cytochrome oxidase subunit 1